jgi:hypothetical protein
MSIDQKMDFCLKIYESYGHQSLAAVVKLLGLETLELQEIRKHGEDMEKEDFCGEFWGWFPQVLSSQTKLSDFEHKPDWYLPFMKAIDESISLRSGKTYDKMFLLGKQQLDTAKSQQHSPEQEMVESPPIESTETDSRSDGTSLEISPEANSESSPSSCEETPTHTNKSRSKQSEANRQLFTGEAITNEKNAHSEKVTDAVSKTAAKSNSSIRSVTPSRFSSRTKRKTQKDADTLPLSRWQRSTAKPSDDFYKFSTLISFLTSRLGWKYRSATNQLRTWVYERAGTPGENGGMYLDDYFYEEDEVIEYCVRNNFKEQHGHLVKKSTSTEPVGNLITPPKSKRMRKEDVTN